MVENKMAGETSSAFVGYYAALLYRLTGDAKYGKFAVANVDDEVAAEEKKIASGERPAIAVDSYLTVGASRATSC